MRLYNVHTLKETQQVLQSKFTFKTEKVHINDAYRRVLSQDVYADINVPNFRRSTVDGYAVKACDTNGASDTMPMLLNDKGHVEMGQVYKDTLKTDQAIYVPTGGMVPDGADAMVMIEYTERFSEDTIAVLKQALPLEHIVGIGSDVQKGEKILSKGQKLQARHLGVLAATGVFYVDVYEKLTASVISTGDELITDDQVLEVGQVFDINTHTIKNRLTHFDIELMDEYVLHDNKSLIKKVMTKAIGQSDITIVSGGSSVGEKDYTAEIIDELDQEGVLIHGLAIKPGKPTIVGKVEDKLVIGLPGHPVSALIVLDQLLQLYLQAMTSYQPVKVKKTISRNIHAAPGKATFVMVSIEGDQAHPIQGKSGMITMMSKADGYVFIDENHEGIDQGTLVDVNLLD